jgi:ADP-heptose:LPS heptosyltransferase
MPSLPDLGKNPAILFVTATRIGDAVLSTGVLRELVERYDAPRLTIAAGPLAAPLFRCVPGLERLIVVAKRAYGRHWLSLFRQVAPQRWDLVLDLRGSALAWLLWTRHRRVVGNGDADRHWVAQLGAMLGMSPPPMPRLWWSAGHDAAAAQLIPHQGPVLAVAPAANWPGKQWRAERFAELVRRLTAPGAILANAPVAVFAAAHERSVAESVLAAVPLGRRFAIVGEPDLLTVAAALRRTALFIGNDSGLMHMAAAVGVPTLGLFGPSPAARYAPTGRWTAVVETDTPYAELVGSPGYDPRTTASLMDTLSVDKAEKAALSFLQTVRTPDRSAAG